MERKELIYKKMKHCERYYINFKNLIEFKKNYLRLTCKGRQLSNKVLDNIINNLKGL